jgi:hypothetical protein
MKSEQELTGPFCLDKTAIGYLHIDRVSGTSHRGLAVKKEKCREQTKQASFYKEGRMKSLQPITTVSVEDISLGNVWMWLGLWAERAWNLS